MSANEIVSELPTTLMADVLMSLRQSHLLRHPFFAGLTEHALRYVCMRSTDQFFMDGDTIVDKSSLADHAMFLSQGTITILITGTEHVMKHAPDWIGDACLFQDDYVRNATVKAMTPVASVIVTRETVRKAVQYFPRNREFYTSYCRQQAAVESSLVPLETLEE
jgi:CRP-like cAMP-binding protein